MYNDAPIDELDRLGSLIQRRVRHMLIARTPAQRAQSAFALLFILGEYAACSSQVGIDARRFCDELHELAWDLAWFAVHGTFEEELQRSTRYILQTILDHHLVKT